MILVELFKLDSFWYQVAVKDNLVAPASRLHKLPVCVTALYIGMQLGMIVAEFYYSTNDIDVATLFTLYIIVAFSYLLDQFNYWAFP